MGERQEEEEILYGQVTDRADSTRVEDRMYRLRQVTTRNTPHDQILYIKSNDNERERRKVRRREGEEGEKTFTSSSVIRTTVPSGRTDEY